MSELQHQDFEFHEQEQDHKEVQDLGGVAAGAAVEVQETETSAEDREKIERQKAVLEYEPFKKAMNQLRDLFMLKQRLIDLTEQEDLSHPAFGSVGFYEAVRDNDASMKQAEKAGRNPEEGRIYIDPKYIKGVMEGYTGMGYYNPRIYFQNTKMSQSLNQSTEIISERISELQKSLPQIKQEAEAFYDEHRAVLTKFDEERTQLLASLNDLFGIRYELESPGTNNLLPGIGITSAESQ